MASLAVLASCDGKAPPPPDVTAETSAPLTAAQIGAAQSAQLLPPSPQIQWMDSDVIPAADSAPITYPYGVNNGVAVGIGYGSATSGGPYAISIGYPFVLNSSGGSYVPGPFPGGSNYFTAVADDGSIVGYGGPASGENLSSNLEQPFTLSPDGTYTMMSAIPGSALDHVVTDLNQNLLAVGTYWDFTNRTGAEGTMAHWMFNGDGTDAMGENSFTTALNFQQITSQDPAQNPWAPAQPSYLALDGSQCNYLGGNENGWKEINDGTAYGPSGVTVMAWVNIPQSACDGPGNTSARVITSVGEEVAVGIRCDGPSATAQGAAITGVFATPTSYLLPNGPTNFFTPTPGHYSIPFNQWTHVALTWDHYVVRTYAGGKQLDSFPYQGNFNLVWYWDWISAGCDPLGSYNFIGGIRDLSVTRSPFGQDTIAKYMNGQGNYIVQGLNLMRYRTNTFDNLPEADIIPGSASPDSWNGVWETGVASDGTIVGYGMTANYVQYATIYEPTQGANLSDLNAQLPADSGWYLESADAINIINNHHVVVGHGRYGGFEGVGYKFDIESATITFLGFVDGGQWGGYTYPSSINSAGHVAGVQRPAPWLAGAPFVYTDDSGITNLNELFDPNTLGGYVLSTAIIDDQDEITGLAYNASLGKYRAYLMKLPGVPSQGQIECAGVADGTPCTHGTFCPSNNVCFHNACGGSDPADNLCLRADGQVAVGGGQYVALFGFDNASSATTFPIVNEVRVGGTIVPSPDPAPPEWFPTGPNPGVFRPSLANGVVTWRVNGQMVSSAGLQTITPIAGLPDTEVTIADDGDDQTIVVVPSNSPYAAVPPQASLQPAPDLGAPFNGVLTGKLDVSPTGAATYTVPIALPPGIEGMVPNLSLVYSSQGEDGIAGQGWSLGGVSSIQRCAKTNVQDGEARPIMLNNGLESTDLVDENPWDGLCLDGRRLIRRPGTNQYDTELTDYSTITRSFDSDNNPRFTVVTKSGETRYYGFRDDSRVMLVDTTIDDVMRNGGQDTTAAAVWALDRVTDQWGNYFELDYKQSTDWPPAEGVEVSQVLDKIVYTGHEASNANPNSASPGQTNTFYEVDFVYQDETRPDVRRTRFSDETVVYNKLLSQINTPLGQYTLTYMPDDVTLPSRLSQISYCSTIGQYGSQCLEPLVFAWKGGNYGWAQQPSQQQSADTYAPPTRLDREILDFDITNTTFAVGEISYPAFGGSEFVDIDGDGRVDLVHAMNGTPDGYPNGAWRNDGTGWTPQPTWTLPENIVNSDGTASGLFADMDGDGLPDLVIGQTSNGIPHVYFNRFKSGGGWQRQAQFETAMASLPAPWSNPHVNFSTNNTLADVDGDGLTDLVQIKTGDFEVLFNTGSGWRVDTSYNYSPWDLSTCTLRDYDGDGLPDIANGTIVLVNHPGSDGVGVYGHWDQELYPYHWSPPQHGVSAGGQAWASSKSQGDQAYGDIDGDGIPDWLIMNPASKTTPSNCNDVGAVPTSMNVLDFGAGWGFIQDLSVSPWNAYTKDLDVYRASLQTFLPYPMEIDTCATWNPAYVTLADINGDGLSDLIVGHLDANQNTVGELGINTGWGWADYNGNDGYHQLAGPNGVVPIVPTNLADSQANGQAFVDLDGDGLVDLVSYGVTEVAHSRAWLNTFQKPVIDEFPNGLAQTSSVHYETITSATAQSDGTYTDTVPPTTGLKYGILPLQVVSSVDSEDGAGVGNLKTTTYSYDSFRVSTYGRGPLGFHSVTTKDSASNEIVVTTYAQGFPYTGLPLSVTKYQGTISPNTMTSQTNTDYCDGINKDQSGGLICTPYSGSPPPAPETTVPIRFVYPYQNVDTSNLYADDGSVTTNVIATNNGYDNFGNLLTSTVTTLGPLAVGSGWEQYQKTITNTYGDPSDPNQALEQQMGKVTKTTTVAQRTYPADTTHAPVQHTTSFDYGIVNTWTDVAGQQQNTLAMVMTRIEPNSTEPNVEEHTAFRYDQFGNVLQKTVCASDFVDCAPGALGPSTLPFRTTTTSYDPGVYSARGLVTSLDYTTPGRFPVKQTDPEGHFELFAYEPLLGGVLIQHTPIDGISVYYQYDAFLRPVLVDNRAGSAAPFNTSIQRYYAPASVGIAGAKVVTVTSLPDGQTKWVYSDPYGRSVSELTYAFDGGFIQTLHSFDRLGRPAGDLNPRETGDPISVTSHVYDPTYNRITETDVGLEDIDGTGPTTSKIQTRYLAGGQVLTQHVEDSQSPTHQQTQVKNGLTRVSETIDANGTRLYFSYDGEGRLTDTFAGDPQGTGGHVQVVYDSRGRKTANIDPDLGIWTYTYNGFGDLVTQTDGNGYLQTMTYDNIGRLTSKTTSGGGASGTAYWLYDLAPGGIGKLAQMISAPDSRFNGPCSTEYLGTLDGNRTVKTMQYDIFGQLQTVVECADGENFQTDYHYDSIGRQDMVTYPTVDGQRFQARSHFTQAGYLQYVSDGSDDSMLWAATSMNAIGQVTGEVTRNGVTTTSTRDSVTGWLRARTAIATANENQVIQSWSYTYDVVGNLLTRGRTDDVNDAPSTEIFHYDPLDRLSTSEVKVPAWSYDRTDAYVIDSYGNLTNKSGLEYSYGGCNAGPHAVCSIGDSATFSYDRAGNLLSSNGRTINYNLENRPINVQQGLTSVDLLYGADGNRVVQSVTTNGDQTTASRTIYVGLGSTGRSLYEKTTKGGTTEHVHFIYAGNVHDGNAFALRVVTDGGASPVVETKYNSFDQLGSTTAVSDEIGRVVSAGFGGPDGQDAGVLGYDPWGERRNPDGQAALASDAFGDPVGRRAFTGQETMASVGLINMNGRLYDPNIGRFMAADPMVQTPTDLQTYNHYSYVLNNPLRYTDPTGHITVGQAYEGFEIGGAILLAATCPASAGIGCALVGAFFAMGVNTEAMVNAGSPTSQIIGSDAIIALGTLISIGSGASGNRFMRLAVGQASALITTALTTKLEGGKLGRNLLDATIRYWAMTAITSAIGEVKNVSQASQDETQANNGSGDNPFHDGVLVAQNDATSAGSDRPPFETIVQGTRSNMCEQPDASGVPSFLKDWVFDGVNWVPAGSPVVVKNNAHTLGLGASASVQLGTRGDANVSLVFDNRGGVGIASSLGTGYGADIGGSVSVAGFIVNGTVEDLEGYYVGGVLDADLFSTSVTTGSTGDPQVSVSLGVGTQVGISSVAGYTSVFVVSRPQ